MPSALNILKQLKTMKTLPNVGIYALSTKVETIPEAVAYAGMNNLRNMIVTDILKNLYEEGAAKTNFSRNNLWLHSAAVAICSQMVCERQIIGTDHAEIGFLLSKDWCLPADAQESIQYHHKNKDIDPQSPTGIIKISEYLVSQLNYCALPNMKTILSDSLLRHMRESIKEYKAIIADLPDELKKANDIFSLG